MRLLAFVFLAALPLAAADFLTYRRSGNLFLIQTGDGVAEIEWVTSSTFRYARRLAPQMGRRFSETAVAVAVAEQDAELRLTTKYLSVSVDKQNMQVRVRDAQGAEVAAFADGALEKELDSRAKRFLFAGAGYGLGKNRQGDCFFYYGPKQKEILEQRISTVDPVTQLEYRDVKLLDPARLPREAVRMRAAGGEPSWDALAAIVSQSLEDSNSAVLMPALNLSVWDASPLPLRRRAIQLGSIFPLVYAQQPLGAARELEGLRTPLHSYLVTYFWEARQRGFPLIRPLAMQFPADPKAAEEHSVFTLGDELLAAPIVSAAKTRSFYLPQGIWTDLATNQKYTGRRVLEMPTPDYLPLFLRNGSILPLDGDPMQLHYTPMLGAEFFLYEPESDEYSQFHAGPAGDYMRLEMESKTARRLEWVIHHVERPKSVERADRWSYDEKAKNLHVFVHAPAGGDVIVNLLF